MRTAAVVPAYNEADTIGAVVEETIPFVDTVVVVDDDSDDNTAAIARRHGASVIEHAVNRGVGGALRTGYRYVIEQGFDLLLQVDGDGQHDPAHIPRLLDAIDGADVVIGSRYLNESYKHYSLVRQVGIRFFTGMVNLLGNVEITDVTSGFRVYRTDVLTEIIHESDDHWAVEQTLEAARNDYRIREVSTEMPTRSQGQSQFSLSTFAFYPVRMADVLLRVLIFR